MILSYGKYSSRLVNRGTVNHFSLATYLRPAKNACSTDRLSDIWVDSSSTGLQHMLNCQLVTAHVRVSLLHGHAQGIQALHDSSKGLQSALNRRLAATSASYLELLYATSQRILPQDAYSAPRSLH